MTSSLKVVKTNLTPAYEEMVFTYSDESQVTMTYDQYDALMEIGES